MIRLGRPDHEHQAAPTVRPRLLDVVPPLVALYRVWWTGNHRHILTDQRLREAAGVLVCSIEEIELYRVRSVSVRSASVPCSLAYRLVRTGSHWILPQRHSRIIGASERLRQARR